VYLIRDPRGILSSRHMAELLTLDIIKEGQVLCNKMLRDFQIFDALAKSGKAKVLFIKYEDMVENLNKSLENIYKFLDQPKPKMDNFLEKTRFKTGKKERTFSVYRKNSTKTAFAWREKMHKILKNKLNNECHEFLTKAGYEL
jgi:predicted house-cleaning noncanonical NTP pyrophosphatase (MazG superfamily)